MDERMMATDVNGELEIATGSVILKKKHSLSGQQIAAECGAGG
jgi:hypothetical protein